MATYKGVKGIKVESLASDPPVATSVGEMWYNTTSNTLKYSIEGGGSWASVANVNTGTRSLAGCGTQTAALKAGGMYDKTNTELYNGTAWKQIAFTS